MKIPTKSKLFTCWCLNGFLYKILKSISTINKLKYPLLNKTSWTNAAACRLVFMFVSTSCDFPVKPWRSKPLTTTKTPSICELDQKNAADPTLHRTGSPQEPPDYVTELKNCNFPPFGSVAVMPPCWLVCLGGFCCTELLHVTTAQWVAPHVYGMMHSGSAK